MKKCLDGVFGYAFLLSWEHDEVQRIKLQMCILLKGIVRGGQLFRLCRGVKISILRFEIMELAPFHPGKGRREADNTVR